VTTQPTPLPPSVAELRDIIAAHYRGDALNQLCALASRAEPAPVADEAAIEAWERDWDAATRTLHFRIQRDEFDGVRAMGARAVRLMRAAPRNDKLRNPIDLGELRDCILNAEAANKPLIHWLERSKHHVTKVLAESPAGDAPCQTMNSSSAADADKSLPSQSPMGPQEMTHTSRSEIISGQSAPTVSTMETLRSEIRGLHVVLGKISQSLKMSGWTVPQDVVDRVRGLMAQNEQYRWMDKKLIADLNGDIDDLRARLQAAEAERDLANETLESMTKERDKLAADLAAAKADRSIRDAEADGRRIQDLTAQLAAAQKERDEERRKAAEHELNWRSVSDKLVDSWAERDNLQADLAAAKADRDAFREKLNTHIEARQNCKHILVGESAVQAVERLAKERDWERHEWPKQIAAALHTEVGRIGATPSMVATAVQLEHEAHTRCLDRLVKAKNELAAAKAERKDGGA